MTYHATGGSVAADRAARDQLIALARRSAARIDAALAGVPVGGYALVDRADIDTIAVGMAALRAEESPLPVYEAAADGSARFPLTPEDPDA